MNARLLAIAVGSALLVLGGAAATAAAGPSQTQPPPRSEPVDGLLERFPIGKAKVTEARPTVPQRELPPAFTPPADDSGTDLAPLTIGAAAAAVLLGMVAAGVLLVRSRRAQPAAVWETTPNLALLYETLANTDREWDKPTEHPTRRSAPVTEVTQDRNQQQPGEPEQADDVTSEAGGSDAASTLEHAGVVEQISAILQSAEAAAAAIRAEAVAKAEQVNQAAVEEGRTHVAKAKEEASRIRAEAEEAARESQSAADSYGAKQRRETEQRIEQMLAQAEVQARATRQAAEEMARQIEETAREREEKLKAQMRPLETSLRRALDGFRGITVQLEELLDGDAPREDKTLVEALSEPVRRTGE